MDMELIGHVVSDQPGIITQVTWELSHKILWAATLFVDHYSDYCYAQLMRGASSEEFLQAKEDHECLAATHEARIYNYRTDRGIYAETLFNDPVNTCGQ